MSLYAAESVSPSAPTEGGVAPPRPSSRAWPWVWLTLVCLVFGASGAFRVWQDRRYDAVKNRVVAPIFSLKDLPTTVGSWRAVEGREAALDPQIARMAGSVDSLVRVYVDDATGVAITILALYGRAEAIAEHTPQVCYPSIGYEQVDSDLVELKSPRSAGPAVFRGGVFLRKGGSVDREEVYYSLRHDGRWSPSMDGNWRVLRYSPAVFKLQVQRKISQTEIRQIDNPSLRFIALMLTEFETRINTAAGPKTRVSSPAPKS